MRAITRKSALPLSCIGTPAILVHWHRSRTPGLQVIDIVRILALETATQPGSIALLEGGRPVAQCDLAKESRTTRSLIPAIQGQLAVLGWQATDLELVAVSQGPGSFTGLRVGVTVAKTLAYAIGAEVMGIDTLEVIARQSTRPEHQSESQSLWAIMDAHRQQLFCARYACDAQVGWRLEQPSHLIDIAAWFEQVQAGDVVAGPPVEKLRSEIHPQAILEDAANCAPRATTVGELAAEAYQQGRRDDHWDLIPNYLRLSAAEEKRAAQS